MNPNIDIPNINITILDKKYKNNLMSSKRFLPLFITQLLFTFNDNSFKNALLIWFTFNIAQKSGQKADLMISIAIGLYILPLFLFSAMAGQFADKFDKAKVARVLMFCEIIVMLTGSILFYFESVLGLILVLFLAGLLLTLLVPVKYSLLPEHLHSNELIKGNSYIEGGTFIATLIGTIFGGLVIDSKNGLMIMAIVFACSSIIGFVSSLYIPKSPIQNKQLINWNFLTETKLILNYAIINKQILLIILAISWFWFVAIMFLMHFATYTSSTLHGTETIVTFLLTIFSVGVAVGTLVCSSLLKGQISTKYIPLSSLAISICIFIFCFSSISYESSYAASHISDKLSIYTFLAFSNYSWAIILSLLVMAVACGTYIIPFYSALQHLSDKRFVARIIAANNVLNALFMGLSSLLAYIFTKLSFGFLETIAVVGVLNLIVFVYLSKSKKLKIDIVTTI